MLYYQNCSAVMRRLPTIQKRMFQCLLIGCYIRCEEASCRTFFDMNGTCEWRELLLLTKKSFKAIIQTRIHMLTKPIDVGTACQLRFFLTIFGAVKRVDTSPEIGVKIAKGIKAHSWSENQWHLRIAQECIAGGRSVHWPHIGV